MDLTTVRNDAVHWLGASIDKEFLSLASSAFSGMLIGEPAIWLSLQIESANIFYNITLVLIACSMQKR